MDLFKRRLVELGKFILSVIIFFAIVIAFLCLGAVIPHIVVVVIAFVVIGTFGLLAIVAFIYWLFIEPFCKGTTK